MGLRSPEEQGRRRYADGRDGTRSELRSTFWWWVIISQMVRDLWVLRVLGQVKEPLKYQKYPLEGTLFRINLVIQWTHDCP